MSPGLWGVFGASWSSRLTEMKTLRPREERGLPWSHLASPGYGGFGLGGLCRKACTLGWVSAELEAPRRLQGPSGGGHLFQSEPVLRKPAGSWVLVGAREPGCPG